MFIAFVSVLSGYPTYKTHLQVTFTRGSEVRQLLNYVVKVSDTSQLQEARPNVHRIYLYHCRWHLPPKYIERKGSFGD
jgi:hypothetical protein